MLMRVPKGTIVLSALDVRSMPNSGSTSHTRVLAVYRGNTLVHEPRVCCVRRSRYAVDGLFRRYAET